MKPAAKRRVVQFRVEIFQRSERRACGLANLAKSVWQYRSKKTGSDVALKERLMDLARQRPRFGGIPEAITIDNGPEFTGKAFDEWAYEKEVSLQFIRPGKPVENAYIESLNGRFRDECLNTHVFKNLLHARAHISAWRDDYNKVRPHSSLGNLSPQEFSRESKRTA